MAFSDILARLARSEVRFLVVGGVAAVLHGAPYTTHDLDIVPDREDGNLDRLLAVLRDLNARDREHRTKRLEPTRGDLRSDGHMLLATDLGPLDVLGTLAEGRDYHALLPSCLVLDTKLGRLQVLDLPALIEIKERTNRPKDRAQLPLLRETLEERSKRPT